LAFRLRSSGTCVVYFDVSSKVLKISGPCKVGAGQRYFWADGRSFHQNFCRPAKLRAATSRMVYTSGFLLELTWEI